MKESSVEALKIPKHLSRFIVEQEYDSYTTENHAVWRFILRRLVSFLKDHAHPCYYDGLKKTGISLERIPRISEIDQAIQEFGWRAVPVSGFIPPAAFMELQAHGVLPIASDMRSAQHLDYTPAPDIVHEAAGHAPILVDPDFALYLKNYAQVARKAILDSTDLRQYELIRIISDLKELPEANPEEISKLENQLSELNETVVNPSEAALLSRMNWWTAEYGLIGSLENPKIYGAGLLSSIGEAKSCLSSKVKKIRLTKDCIEYKYDITEPQPQLFIASDFMHLSDVLADLSTELAFKVGGTKGCLRAKNAKTVNTIEFESGFQCSGILTSFQSQSENPFFLEFKGPIQFCKDYKQFLKTDKSAQVLFGKVEFRFSGKWHDFFEFDFSKTPELNSFELRIEDIFKKTFYGQIKTLQADQRKKIWFIETPAEETLLFVIKSIRIKSVFGGAADREAFGPTDEFDIKKVNKSEPTERQIRLNAFLLAIQMTKDLGPKAEKLIRVLCNRYFVEFADHWLPAAELYQLTFIDNGLRAFSKKLEEHLKSLPYKSESIKSEILLDISEGNH